MIWSAVVQYYIYKTNPCGKSAATCVGADDNVLTSPMTVWVQTGSYVLIALSEIFASTMGLEYAFTKALKNMRSLVMSIFLFTNAISLLLKFFIHIARLHLLLKIGGFEVALGRKRIK